MLTGSTPSCTRDNTQNLQDTSFLSPPAKVAAGGPPLDKLAGQHAPPGTCFDNIQDRV